MKNGGREDCRALGPLMVRIIKPSRSASKFRNTVVTRAAAAANSGDEEEELTDGLSRMRIRPFFVAYQDLQIQVRSTYARR